MRNDVGAAAQTYPPEAGNRPRRRLDKPFTVSIGSGKNDKTKLWSTHTDAQNMSGAVPRALRKTETEQESGRSNCEVLTYS